MTSPPCDYYTEWHRPRAYRYRVADPGFRLMQNRYGRTCFIGLALVIGRYAYCVKWANAGKVKP